MRAKRPVGGISATKLVPCARCWLYANSSPRSGTSRTPPPIPNIPEATPQTHATAKIPALRPTLSATGPLLACDAHRLTFLLSLSPEQDRCQHQEAPEKSF